jgi:pyruvate ferredoxin oxidoreductase alpha subunit
VTEKKVVTGHEAVANAMRQVSPDVVAVYPITPQSEIAQYFAQYVADGEVDTEIVTVESEHSAMSACVGSSVAGSRTITATASQGLALMVEIVYIAASMRCPIVMALCNRALSAPINIHCDHSDSMLARDSGVFQIYCEDAQEAYDYMIMAQKIAENENVLLPGMVCLDGFTLTHTAQVATFLDDKVVKDFVGEYQAKYPLLDVDNPTTQGPFDMPDYYFEHKRQQVDAIYNVPEVFLNIQKEYSNLSGRNYEGYFEPYKLEDAEYAVAVLGSTAGTARVAVDELREEGKKVGLLKVRLYRPFPRDEIAEAAEHLKALGIMDRAISFGTKGALYSDITSAFSASEKIPRFNNYIYGLGGRDITIDQIKGILKELEEKSLSQETRYIGVRE